MPPLVCPSDSKPTANLGCQTLAQKFPNSNINQCCAFRERCIRTCDHSKLMCEYEFSMCMLSICQSLSLQYPILDHKTCLKRWSDIHSDGYKSLNLTDAYDFSCEYMFELRKVSGCSNPYGTPKSIYLDTYSDPELDTFQRFWDIPL
ncbi:hypothetical protein K7432_005424 [Basidiobolus ranarum]|uniref:Uncharacterized protein n=1 Tax=Basidiobolus ranarum TaxID=34480 RepID=A0ABR2W366_9FUNG